jgi:peroxiredoxin
MPLEVGEKAPDFSLRDQNGETRTLSSFAGRALAVVFYPWAFSRVCTGELGALQANLTDLQGDDRALVAVSCDPMFSLRAFADADGLTFPLLSDHWPHGAVARGFGVFNTQTGAADRSTFILDGDGRVRWTVHNAIPDARDMNEYVVVLDRLRR